jgi:hypothetical protein
MGEVRNQFGDALADFVGELPTQTPVEQAVSMLKNGYPYEIVEAELGADAALYACASDPDLRVHYGIGQGEISAA